MKLSDGTIAVLNSGGDELVDRYFSRPKAFVDEMIHQINERNHYYGIFTGKRGMVFLDIGANIGLVSIYAHPSCSRVVAVEAEPETCRVMAALCSPFRIEAVNLALSAKTGTVTLSVNADNWTCHTTTNPVHGQAHKEVESASFPDLLRRCGLDRVDICKVDVEGAEIESLTADIIRSSPVKRWYIEAHKTPQLTLAQSVSEMKSRLESAGFSVAHIRTNTLLTRE